MARTYYNKDIMQKYMKDKCKVLICNMPKQDYADLKEWCQSRGFVMTTFVKQAIADKMERDG